MTENELTQLQERVFALMYKTLEHHKMLFSITKHSKKKEKHKRNIKWQEEVIADYKEECDYV